MKINLINENFQSFYGKNLLKSRGIEDLENFLYPTEKNLEDWKKLKNIEKGIELLDSKIKDNAHFILLMDSDCDGFCSATIFYQFIKSINKNIKITLLLHEGKQHGLEDKWKETLDFDESIDNIKEEKRDIPKIVAVLASKAHEKKSRTKDDLAKRLKQLQEALADVSEMILEDKGDKK